MFLVYLFNPGFHRVNSRPEIAVYFPRIVVGKLRHRNHRCDEPKGESHNVHRNPHQKAFDGNVTHDH